MSVSNVIVVDSAVSTTQSDIDYSAMGYRTVVPTSTPTGTDEDSSYPFANVYDFRDNTKYSPSTVAGTTTIVLTQTTATEIDYFAFAIHNANEAGMSGFFEVDDGSGYTLKASI